jgi:hypothetical protein
VTLTAFPCPDSIARDAKTHVHPPVRASEACTEPCHLRVRSTGHALHERVRRAAALRRLARRAEQEGQVRVQEAGHGLRCPFASH